LGMEGVAGKGILYVTTQVPRQWEEGDQQRQQ